MRPRLVRAALLALAMLASFASQPATGALIRVDFAGSVEEISGQIHQDAGPPIPVSSAEAEAALGGSIHVGTPFSGFFVYDDSAIQSSGAQESEGIPGFPTQAFAYYSFPNGMFPGPGVGPPFAAHGEIGSFVGDGQVGQGGSAGIDVYDNEVHLDGAHPSSFFVSAGLSSPPASGDSIALTWLQFYASGESSGSPLHGTSLHSIPWDLESFPLTSAALFFHNGDNLQVRVAGSVTHLVPETAGAGLVALAACAMLAACRELSRP